MIQFKVAMFLINNIDKINEKLDGLYLTSSAIISIESNGEGFKVYHHTPVDWNAVNCIIKLPEWVKKQYGVTN